MAKLAQVEIRNRRERSTTAWACAIGDRSFPPSTKCRCPCMRRRAQPALLLDWNRFCSDTIIAFVRMQADVLHEICPDHPVTVNLRALHRKFDHFDMAAAVDFVSVESNAAIKTKSAELACDIDMLRSLKKSDIKTPRRRLRLLGHRTKGRPGQLAGRQLARASRRHPAVHLPVDFARRERRALLSAGGSRASATKNFSARCCRTTSKAIPRLQGNQPDRRGIEMLAPAIKDTKVVAEACILYTHDNDWTLQQPMQPNKFFNLREHIQLIYNALHDRNISVDFARPTETFRNTKSFSRRRCTCCPPARPTGSNFTSKTAARSSARSTPASSTNIASCPTPATRTT
jgi:beta-galactosidase